MIAFPASPANTDFARSAELVTNSEFSTTGDWFVNVDVGAPVTTISGGEMKLSVGDGVQVAASPLASTVSAASLVELDLKFRGTGGNVICQVKLVPAAEGWNSPSAVSLYLSPVGSFSSGITIKRRVLSSTTNRSTILIRENTGVASRAIYIDHARLRILGGTQ